MKCIDCIIFNNFYKCAVQKSKIRVIQQFSLFIYFILFFSKSDPTRYNKYGMNGMDEETVEIATAHGGKPTTNGVQRILVDPDRPSTAYANYAEQVILYFIS